MTTNQITTTLAMKPELRPCIVCGNMKALFHGWEWRMYTVPTEITVGGAPGEQESKICGIVELKSGYVGRANLKDIRFLDSKEKFEEVWKGEPDEAQV